MQTAHEFLKALSIVLCVAAVTTVVFQRLRQPVVLGYILAGMIVGPYVPIPLVADPDIVRTLSEFGVILLMFSIGLEFSVGRIVQVGPAAGLTAMIECSLMIWLGYVVGRGFGWTTRESLFAGGIIAISSTTIIAKAFDELGVRGRLREAVLGVLIAEDLVGILLITVLTALAAGQTLTAGALALSSARLAAFLGGLVIVGMLIVPRGMRLVYGLRREETTVVAAIGLCFAAALVAQAFGYSVALGAFLAGSLVAESGLGHEVGRLVSPVRDMFVAIFFVSVGMLIDPELIARHWGAVAALAGAVLAGKVLSVTLGAFLTGHGTRTALQAGMSMAQIGEFSYIIAGLGIASQSTGSFLVPVAVAVSAITTFATPWLIRGSGRVAAEVDRRLPRTLQIFAALYGSWVEQLRAAGTGRARSGVRHWVRLLLLDAGLLVGLLIGAALAEDAVGAWLHAALGLSATLARVAVLAATIALAAPFCAGIVRVAARLGEVLAEAALPLATQPPAGAKALDLGAAPRRALRVTLQVAILLLTGMPVLALTQPFYEGPQETAVLLLLLGLFGIAFWRSARELHAHVQAGAAMIVDALASYARRDSPTPADHALARVRELLPGLGEPLAVQV